jgi:prepilin-type N-terminal cleavage/methylation domain-containing protein
MQRTSTRRNRNARGEVRTFFIVSQSLLTCVERGLEKNAELSRSKGWCSRHEACYHRFLVTCLNSAPNQFDRRRHRVDRGFSRGFTLTEVMVTIFLIALLAAVASPSFINVMRDTNLSRLNMQIAEIYRKAYIESAEQATYLVRWTGGNSPSIELVKATLDTETPTLVSPRRCNAIDWTAAAHTHQTYSFASPNIPEFATLGYLVNGANEAQRADICYSQRRAFVRYDNGAFANLPGAARIYVKNMRTNVTRRVLIPSFGLPRLIQ